MHYKKRTNRFRFDAAKRMATTPERIDALLHQARLVNPTPPVSAGALEAKAILDKATQLKGTVMPDIKTALSNALENGKRQALNATLDAWEQDEKETQLEKPVIGKSSLFEVTPNVSRETFNYVLNNPRCTMADIKRDLGAKGFNTTSVGSLLTQFVHQRHINRSADGQYIALNTEYKPLMTRAKWDKTNGLPATTKAEKRKEKLKQGLAAVKRKNTAKHNAQAAGIGALPVQEKKPEVTSILISRNWTAQGVVDKLTVVQARQLYDVLKSIFGG